MKTVTHVLLSVVGFLVGYGFTASQELTVSATAGFGPFTTGVSVPNTFIVQGIPATERVSSVAFTIVGSSDPTARVRPLVTSRGTSTRFSTNMASLPLNATLIVHVETILPTQEKRTQVLHRTITMQTPKPVVGAGNGPFIVGSSVRERLTVSSLPPSTRRVTLRLVRANGTVIDSVVRTGTAIDTASIVYATSAHRRGTRLTVSY